MESGVVLLWCSLHDLEFPIRLCARGIHLYRYMHQAPQSVLEYLDFAYLAALTIWFLVSFGMKLFLAPIAIYIHLAQFYIQMCFSEVQSVRDAMPDSCSRL